ncbi:8115_t:CDS:1, partial [Funneliformis caledonium]
NFDRTKRQKKSALKLASKGSSSITKYFTSTTLSNNQINTIANDLISLEEIIERKGFNLALEELNILIKDKSLISQVKN